MTNTALSGATYGIVGDRQIVYVVEFLVEFEVNVPDGIPELEVTDREDAEASAAARLAEEGHLVRVWRRPMASGRTTVVGLYRANSDTELDGLIRALPFYDWMQVTVTPLEPHPNDPAGAQVA
jgi:muconolactone D-isomerase